jgi:hypothetical protein
VQTLNNAAAADKASPAANTEDKAMKLNPFPATYVGAIALAGLLCCLPLPIRAQFGPETKLSVGVFSRSLVVQTFYSSAAWNAKLQAMIKERENAATNGDAAKIDQIDRELAVMQTLAQKQLAGDVSLKNIYDQLKADWPAIAKEADVDIIVESPVFLTKGVAVTDVTPFIVKRLSARPK